MGGLQTSIPPPGSIDVTLVSLFEHLAPIHGRSTAALAAISRSVVVHVSVGTVKLAVATVADPAGTEVW